MRKSRIVTALALLLLAAPAAAQQLDPVNPPYVQGPASVTSGNLAVFNGTSGKLIKGGGAVPTGTVTSVTCGTGLSGGAITTSGTCAVNAPSWSIYRATNQTGIAKNTSAIINFATALYDASSVCDLATNVGRCTPTVAGKYHISAAVYLTAIGTAGVDTACQVYKNGSVALTNYSLSAAADAGVSCDGDVVVNGTTDYLEIKVFVADISGGTMSTDSGAADVRFSGVWVAP